jgi:hypothetical protein
MVHCQGINYLRGLRLQRGLQCGLQRGLRFLCVASTWAKAFVCGFNVG